MAQQQKQAEKEKRDHERMYAICEQCNSEVRRVDLIAHMSGKRCKARQNGNRICQEEQRKKELGIFQYIG